jgi:hypothetical protein
MPWTAYILPFTFVLPDMAIIAARSSRSPRFRRRVACLRDNV